MQFYQLWGGGFERHCALHHRAHHEAGTNEPSRSNQKSVLHHATHTFSTHENENTCTGESAVRRPPELCTHGARVPARRKVLHLVRVECRSDTPCSLADERPHTDITRQRHAHHPFPVVRALLYGGVILATLPEEHARPCQAAVDGGGAGSGGGTRGRCSRDVSLQFVDN